MSTELDNSDVVPSVAEFASELSQDIDAVPAGAIEQSQKIAPSDGTDFGADIGTLPVAAMPRGVQGDVDNIVMDIPVTIKVVLGTARMPVAAVSKLARGTVIKLDNNVGDPVDIYVNGRFLARGQVVVLDEGASRFGVTLTQVGGATGAKK